MTDLLQHKCPNCYGSMEFDGKTGKMRCPYCDTSYSIEELNLLHEAANASVEEEAQEEEREEEARDNFEVEETGNEDEKTSWTEEEKEEMSTYSCQSCGGEVVGDASTAATSCPFCGNHVIITKQFSDDLRPDYVIPFKLDKKAAKEALKKHVESKKFVPAIFKSENHIDEIKGIYVPFWIFDYDSKADLKFTGANIRRWSSGDTDYEETSLYDVTRSGEVHFDCVPVDGSTKMADDLMESIEPFDWNEAVDFQTAYLAGFLADKYDVESEESVRRAKARMKVSTESAIEDTVTGYDRLTLDSSNVTFENGNVAYALYPVWLLNTTWDKKIYTFAMNGQTGKFIGDLPLDKSRYWRMFGILTLIIGALIYGLMWLII